MIRIFACVLLLLAGPLAAQTPEEADFAKEYLGKLQERSFRNHREYCGFFGYDANDQIVAAKPRSGEAASCTSYFPNKRIRVFASYHTHGGWDEGSDGEIPSVLDVEGDMENETDGFVSTPGGRLWHIDGETGVSRQVCGRGCLPMDPSFQREPIGSVPKRITLERLKIRQQD